ncbi:MAG: mechanosensitive ion channel domain-containing protein [candidate division Zixibacteria bacterium]
MSVIERLTRWLESQGVSLAIAEALGWVVAATVVAVLAYIVNLIAKRVLVASVRKMASRTQSTWDDALVQRKVFERFSHIAPVLVVYFSAALFGPAQDWILKGAVLYILVASLLVLSSFLDAVVDIYRKSDKSGNRPIKGYVQVIKIAAFILGGIYAFGEITGQDVSILLGGIGAMTAVLMLVFKDSILGLVASIQLSSNDMVRLGDWVEMPKYGADGDVVDISLNTIKIQNWDKTISTIPSYALISDSFRNWRGMSESGGRRIKRSVWVDTSSIRFCSTEMLTKFSKIQLLRKYIATKQEELAAYNAKHQIDVDVEVNGRRMTNIGVFRAYLVAYLRQHPSIHQDMTFLVRQLPPGEHGLPIELYVFSNDQEWANYEAIQSDIFDHILAVLPHFELRAFQYPTGYDLRRTSSITGLQ